MEQILGEMYTRFPIYMLAGLRMTGLFIMSPVFGKRGMPAGAKIGLAVLLTYLILPVLSIEPSDRLFNLYAFTLECIKEFLLGLALGYITTVFFSVVITASELIDNQIGFGMVSLFDPQSSIQAPLFGNFLNVLIMLLFLSVDGHHTLIRILCSSFSRIPPGKIVISPALGTMAAEYFTTTFVLAVQIALPVVMASLMAETALAVIMRTVPQMNVFIVGIPLKVMLGIIVMIVVLPVYRVMTGNIFDQMNTAVVHFFEGFASS